MYLSSDNKGADQLCGYPASDSVPFFSHMQKAGLLMARLIMQFSKCFCLTYQEIKCQCFKNDYK